jgi:hypothetical protein
LHPIARQEVPAWFNSINDPDPLTCIIAHSDLDDLLSRARKKSAMISLEDCIAFCGLDEDQVAAISEHEHIPEIAATALADYLLKQPHGGEAIRTMIIDDIRKALDSGRVRHAQELFMALRHFLDQYPEARAGVEV